MIIGQWIQKPHGWWCPLLLSDTFEFWVGHVIAGGYCSRHWHDLKFNVLYSRDAVLLVKVWPASGDGLVAIEYIVRPCSGIAIAAGDGHQFTVLRSGRIFETYYGRCDPQDIVRCDSNGWRPPQSVPALSAGAFQTL